MYSVCALYKHFEILLAVQRNTTTIVTMLVKFETNLQMYTHWKDSHYEFVSNNYD